MAGIAVHQSGEKMVEAIRAINRISQSAAVERVAEARKHLPDKTHLGGDFVQLSQAATAMARRMIKKNNDITQPQNINSTVNFLA